MSNLLDLAKLACAAAVAAGAEFADVSAWNNRSISLQLERSAFKNSDARRSMGISVRAFFRGGIGAASTTGLNKDDAHKVGQQAAELAKMAQPDPDFISLPAPAQYREIPGLYDEKLTAYSLADIVEILSGGLHEALQVAPDALVEGGAGVYTGEHAFVNSLGIAVTSPGSSISASISVIVRHGDDVGSFYDYDFARTLDRFNPIGIGERAAQEALRFLGAKKIVGGDLPVVVGPLSSRSIFYGIASGINAESVQRGRSWLTGKKGQQIASEVVTLIDDPFIPGGAASSRYDGEGYPRQVTTIVENGVLQTYLHNSYTAGKAKEPNTGHSTRGGVSPTNLIPALGQKTAAEIIGEVEKGIYVARGNVSPNGITGDVSSTVDSGFMIENGQITYPIKNTMFAGSMLDLLKSIDAISSDYREKPGQIMPTVRIAKAKVAGGR